MIMWKADPTRSSTALLLIDSISGFMKNGVFTIKVIFCVFAIKVSFFFLVFLQYACQTTGVCMASYWYFKKINNTYKRLRREGENRKGKTKIYINISNHIKKFFVEQHFNNKNNTNTKQKHNNNKNVEEIRARWRLRNSAPTGLWGNRALRVGACIWNFVVMRKFVGLWNCEILLVVKSWLLNARS